MGEDIEKKMMDTADTEDVEAEQAKKDQATKEVKKQLHKIVVKIAPMSKAEIKEPTTNTKLIESIINVFNSKSMQYLYSIAPYNTVKEVTSVLSQPHDYISFSSVVPISKLITNQKNKNIKFTKHADLEFEYLLKKGYKYAHRYYYNIFKYADSKLGTEKVKKLTQVNAPTKRNMYNIIKLILHDLKV